MNILSINFAISVVLSVIVYWFSPKEKRWTILFIGSCYCICRFNNVMGALITLGMFAGTWFIGLLQQYVSLKFKKVLMLLAVFLNVSLLIVFKDINFFVNLFNHFGGNLEPIVIVAPIGMSYFTLALIGYSVGLFWDMQTPERNFAKFFVFAGFFPLLISGPITEYAEMKMELWGDKQFTYKDICFGLQRILWGVLKKLVISERIGIIVDTIYADTAMYSGNYIWIAMMLFVLQLYADFSGSIDIIMGTAQLYGIKLPENFNLPFISCSLSEFWRRWHITLGVWLKNYVFYPIMKSNICYKFSKHSKKRFGKKLGKKLPVWSSLFVTWFIIGMWHGGSWNYIIGVGLFQWFIIVLGELLEPLGNKVCGFLNINTECFSWRSFQTIRTIVYFTIGNGMFRCYQGMHQVVEVFKAGVSKWNPWIIFDGSFLNMGLTTTDFSVLRFTIVVLIMAGIVNLTTGSSVREWIARQNLFFRWTIWITLFVVIIVYGKYGPGYSPNDFIYRGF